MPLDSAPVDPAAAATTPHAGSTVEVLPAVTPADTTPAPDRPAWLPEKFKSAEDLARSYAELEKKLGAPKPAPTLLDKAKADTPAPAAAAPTAEVPEKYALELPPGMAEVDTAWMKDAKLSNDQAQAVLVHYTKNVLPQLDAQRLENEMVRLSGKWGMQDKQAVAHRIGEVEAWASKQLPPTVVTELSRTAEGVSSMYDMMRAGHKSFFQPQASDVPRMSRADLDSQVADPRFNTDAGFRAKVEANFKEFYRE